MWLNWDYVWVYLKFILFLLYYINFKCNENICVYVIFLFLYKNIILESDC